MKYFFKILLSFFIFYFFINASNAQCAVCTKTALQMGEKPAKALNGAIIYLMMMPFAIVGVISYRWWTKNER